MVLSKCFEPPDLITIGLKGAISADDQAQVLEWVRSAIRHLGKVRVLIVLEGFVGWALDEHVLDEARWLRDDEPVMQMAIVGRPEWGRAVLTFIAQPLRQMPIRYFDTEPAARQWLGVAPHTDTTSAPA
jgi:hypothetical protein